MVIGLDKNSILYSDEYGEKEWIHHTDRYLTIADSTKIKYTTSEYDTDEHIDKAENLAIMNSYCGVGSANREVAFTGIFDNPDMNGTYVLSANIGNTSLGTYSLNGVKNGTINTTLDMNSKNGFDITSAGSEVVLNNFDIKNGAYIAEVASGSELKLNNVNILSSNTSGVNNNGTLELTGSNLISKETTGTGSFELVSGTTTLNANVTQNTLTITSGILNNNADISVKIGSNDSTILGTGNLFVANDFVNNGNITQDSISNNGTFINNGAVSANINNNGTLSSSANNLTGNINNNGNLNLSGGTLNSTVTGNGTTILQNDIISNNNISQNSLTINNDVTLINNSTTNINLSLTNNGTIRGTGSIVNGNNGVNNGTIAIDVKNNGTFINNSQVTGDFLNEGTGAKVTTNMTGLLGKVTNNGGEIHYNDGGSTISNIIGNGTIHLDSDRAVLLNHDLDANTLVLNNGTLLFGQNTDISKGGLIANGGNINIRDGKISKYNLGSVVANGKTNLAIDFDLSTLTSDSFIGTYSGKGKLNIDNIQIQGTTTKNKINVFLGDTTKISGAQLSTTDQNLPTIMTPIQKMYGKIENNYLMYSASNSGKTSDFNPAVFAGPVAAETGGFLLQSQTLQEGFYHLNRYTKYSLKERLVAENANKYALKDTNSVPAYVRESVPETSQAFWTVPHTSFEKVNLRGGLKVNNIIYGGIYGTDTDLIAVEHGFKRVMSTFIGYNGVHQSYNGISTNQEGGTIGITGTWYKGNFFTALTASVGASAGQAHTSFGTDYFAMLTSGVANKTGYNFEFADGKFIIQPQLYTGYIFTKPFDYKNSAGVKIKSDPLNAIQVAPGIKFIGNFSKGLQAYAGIDVMMNFMGKTKYHANETKLPELSVKPYVQYGVGIQKTWGERFTGFFQTILRSGGRNGISFSAGLRWLIGKDPKKTDKL